MPSSTDFSNLPSWLTGALNSGGVSVPSSTTTGTTRSTSGVTYGLPELPANNYGFGSFSASLNPANYIKPANPATNVTGQSVSNNLASAPDIASLTNLINQLNINAQQQANQNRIPGAQGLEEQSSGNIGSLLAGTIPQDVITQLAQRSAERGVQMGIPGSDNVNSSLLRSLGLTSLDLQQLGQQNLSAAYARNPVAKLFDPTSQLITPYQQGALNNEANKLALDWYALLHPQYGGGRGGGGGQQQQQPTTPDMSWFKDALNQAANLNQPRGVPNVVPPPPTTYSNNPILDTDFGFGDTNNYSVLDSPSFDTAGSNYDPFAEYDWESLVGG